MSIIHRRTFIIEDTTPMANHVGWTDRFIRAKNATKKMGEDLLHKMQHYFSSSAKIIIAQEDFIDVTDNALYVAENGTTTYSRMWRRAATLAEWLRRTRLWSGVVIPVNLARMKHYITQFRNGNRDEKIDAGLMFTGELSQLFYNTSALAMGLVDIKWIKRSALKWAEPMMIVSIPLQFGYMIARIKAARQSQHLIEKLGLNNKKRSIEDIDTICAVLIEKKKEAFLKRNFEIKDDIDSYVEKKIGSYLERRFDVNDGIEFKERLESIQEEKNPATLDKTMNALKKRLVSKKLSNYVGAVAVAISLIASAIFVVSPFSPLGYFLFTLSAVMEVGIYLYDYHCNYQFAKQMDLSLDDFLHVKICTWVNEKWNLAKDYWCNPPSLSHRRVVTV